MSSYEEMYFLGVVETTKIIVENSYVSFFLFFFVSNILFILIVTGEVNDKRERQREMIEQLLRESFFDRTAKIESNNRIP